MVRLRAAKIDGITVPDLEVDDPHGDAELLVLGWGSTYGPIGAGCRRVRALGHSVAQAHLRHLNPMPANLGDVLARYRTVLVPEMNLGPAGAAAARPLPGRRARATRRSPGCRSRPRSCRTCS